LRNMGLPKDVAIFLGRFYERVIFNHLSGVNRSKRVASQDDVF
jgi:hypothetical protein